MAAIESPTDFYNLFVDDYHLIFPNWEKVVRDQGVTLKTFIRKEINEGASISVLDCSCGIATQAIGLALQGYKITGTDISPKEIERAKRDAARLGAPILFHVADFRCLESIL